MTVYLVLGIDAHDTFVLGVYDSKEKAEAAIEFSDEDFAFIWIQERLVE